MYFVFDSEQKNWFIRIKNVCYDTIVRKKYLFDNIDLQFEFCKMENGKKTYRTIYYNEYKKKVVYIKLYFYLLHFNIKNMAK